MITVIEVAQISHACPTEWEGITDDGRHIYVRYRFSNFSVQIADTRRKASKGYELFRAKIGEEMSGTMGFDQMRDVTARIIQWPEVESEPKPEEWTEEDEQHLQMLRERLNRI
jgi:hypothetical protein